MELRRGMEEIGTLFIL